MTSHPESLKYVSDDLPGYTRVCMEEAISYCDERGNTITDQKELERIKSLVIPPNWKDVWICKSPEGHLQATGKDEKGRKQYLYHEEWIAYRQLYKFSSLFDFGMTLPEIRKKINKDLDAPNNYRGSMNYKKVLALAVKLLDCHYLRIGNDFYLHENETYGLTTLRRKHLDKEGNALKLSYKAKSGKQRNIKIDNKILVNLLLKANELPGYEIFRYKEGSKTYRIHSEDVNAYIKEASGQDFSAKDFRTWGGTVTAIDKYEEALDYTREGSNRKLETSIVRKVAKTLGNTVNTAREYYIHPKVLDALICNHPNTYYNEHAKKYSENNLLKKNEAIALEIIKE